MKVSAYCLVYNHENYLRSALDGFVNQITNFDYEVIVHDDASTDASAQIIREYAQKYPHIIKPIYQSVNQFSQGKDFFKADILPRMSGEYFAACEGDDYWTDPTKLQRQVDFLDSHPEYTACVHNTLLLDMRTGFQVEMYTHSEDEDISFLETAQNGSCSFHTSAIMYRRKFGFEEPEFFAKVEGNEDYPLAMYLTLCGKVRFLNRCMSVYRFGTVGSWTMKNTHNIRANAKSYENNANLLEAVDEYSEYRYHDELQKMIVNHRYQALYFSENYAALRVSPYREIYLSMGMSYRIKTYIKQLLNPLYHVYRDFAYGKNAKEKTP